MSTIIVQRRRRLVVGCIAAALILASAAPLASRSDARPRTRPVKPRSCWYMGHGPMAHRGTVSPAGFSMTDTPLSCRRCRCVASAATRPTSRAC